MTDEIYREALKQARAAYEEAQVRYIRAESEGKAATLEMARLRRTIVALAVMCGEKVEGDALGLTEAVRAVMDAATNQLTLAEVKQAVEDQGFDMSTQSNPDASVSSVLRRLLSAGEVTHKKLVSPNGKTKAVWRGKNFIKRISDAPPPPPTLRT
jgi:hypothetical protein